MSAQALVVGQMARDLVLQVTAAPGESQTATVRSRRELLGGKGANQAVALAQLGVPTALLAAAGDDRAGRELLDQARSDGIDVSPVRRRPGAATALIVDIVDAKGTWRYLEHIPRETLLGSDDLASAAAPLAAADTVLVQLQQPASVATQAAQLAHQGGARVVLDGAPADSAFIPELLANADVVRADAYEAEQLVGQRIPDISTAKQAGADLLEHGPSLAVLEVSGAGNVFVDREGGSHFLPVQDVEVVDPTGAGDALLATLTAALCQQTPIAEAARYAVRAAADTTEHAGGRPQLSPHYLQAC